jgi:NAD(P)-dependent dehydrogenase (short-subunit alcohol dehydrogenase family)
MLMVDRRKWHKENIPDLSGRIAIVTGANAGIGYETAKLLSWKGARVIMACRDLEKAEIAKEQIQRMITTGSLEVMKLDIGDLDSIHRFADKYMETYTNLDIIIHNAAIITNQFQLSADNFDLVIATNYLGPFALTGRLLSRLINTKKSRVVGVNSGIFQMSKLQNFDTWMREDTFSTFGRYSDSKLAMLTFIFELQRRLEKADASTIAVSAHPGGVNTTLMKDLGFFPRLLPKILGLNSAETGALQSVKAATDPDVRGGDFYGPSLSLRLWGHPKKYEGNKISKDLIFGKRLWDVSEELTKVVYHWKN